MIKYTKRYIILTWLNFNASLRKDAAFSPIWLDAISICVSVYRSMKNVIVWKKSGKYVISRDWPSKRQQVNVLVRHRYYCIQIRCLWVSIVGFKKNWLNDEKREKNANEGTDGIDKLFLQWDITDLRLSTMVILNVTMAFVHTPPKTSFLFCYFYHLPFYVLCYSSKSGISVIDNLTLTISHCKSNLSVPLVPS